MIILSIVMSVVLLGLGIIHFNWVIGGTYGFDKSLPTKANGEKVLNPKRIDCAIVAVGLTAFGLFYFFQSGVIEFEGATWIFKYGGWIIPAMFLLRAIGEFKYVGFFKSIKATEFARLDSKLFSPLCLIVGIIGLTIQLVK
jgi:hypothetical protein